MNQQSGSNGTVVVVTILLLLLMLIGGAAMFVWQRAIVAKQQTELAIRDAIVAEEQAQAAANRAQELAAEKPEAKPTPVAEDIDEVSAIKEVLTFQKNAWNQGDIDTFMESYWKSEDLTFSSGGKTTRSWQGTIERYKERYPTREAMGTLDFSDLEVQLLGADAALVLGRWELKDLAGGNFTLVMKKLSDGWVIIHDHSSKSEETDE